MLLNECPEEFCDSVMKPCIRNHPSDTIYQGTVIILHVMGISEQFRCTEEPLQSEDNFQN
jgi:hypothetical protein